MKSTWKKYLLYGTYILLASGLLYGLLQLILSGYTVIWTGFGDYTMPSGEIERGKTLWDWMDLLVIPVVLAIGVFFLNKTERAIEREAIEKRAELEREIAKDHQQQATFQSYLDRMSELILEDKLKVIKNRIEGRTVAKIRTVSVLRVLDMGRQNLVLQFLRDAKLVIDSNSILNEANMSGLKLIDVDMSGIFLQNVNFQETDFGEFAILMNTDLTSSNFLGVKLRGALLMEANLRSATLFSTNLELSNLSRANLQLAGLVNSNLKMAQMHGANLTRAFLSEANLEKADLENANLFQADLRNANLKDAKVTPEQLAQAKSLKGAIMPDGTIHE